MKVPRSTLWSHVPTCNKAFAALRTMNRAPKASFQISQGILGPERKSWDYGWWVIMYIWLCGGGGRVVVVALVLGKRSRVGSSEPHATKLGLYCCFSAWDIGHHCTMVRNEDEEGLQAWQNKPSAVNMSLRTRWTALFRRATSSWWWSVGWEDARWWAGQEPLLRC